MRPFPLVKTRELLRFQTLALVWPETLMHSRRLSCALIEFLNLLKVVESFLSATPVLVWPGLERKVQLFMAGLSPLWPSLESLKLSN